MDHFEDICANEAVLLPLCDALDARRVERQWSTVRLARMAGLARMSVLNLLSLRTDPQVSTIVKTARALGYDVAIVVTPHEANSKKLRS